MAIVKMNKFTLLAFESQKEKLIEEFQSFSSAQFINLQSEDFQENHEEFKGLEKENVDSKYVECDENLSKAKFALDFLKSYVPKKSGLQSLREEKEKLCLDDLKKKVNKSNWQQAYVKVREKEVKLAELETKKSSIHGEIETIEPWKGFDAPFSTLKDLKKAKYFLGTVPKQYEETIKTDLEEQFKFSYFEILNSTSQEVYLLILTHEYERKALEEQLRIIGFAPFNTKYEKSPEEILMKCQQEISKVNEEIAELIEEVKGYVNEERELELAYEYYGNLKERMLISHNFLKTDKTIVIQGWVPIKENERLNSFITKALGKDFYINFEEVKEEEIPEVPVKLTNNILSGPFESITEMYSLPRYNEIDPTPVMTPFYLLFFGMMIADVGYGLVMFIAALIAMRLFKNNESSKNFAKFFLYLSIPSIIFGGIYGSFFNDVIKIPGLINPSQDVNVILIMSIVFGVVQIFVGLGIKAFTMIKLGDPLGAFYDVGAWYMILIGVAVLLGGNALGLPPIAGTIATVVVVIAALIIIFTNGRAEETRGARIGQGLYALYGITGYIGDLVSYTRLMALGLAGGCIAGALNLLIGMLPGGIVAILIGPIVFILAHTFNLLLSMLGAYVHTARLQYVEYFSKFYEGGGKPFTPFKTLNKYIILNGK